MCVCACVRVRARKCVCVSVHKQTNTPLKSTIAQENTAQAKQVNAKNMSACSIGDSMLKELAISM